VVCEILEPGRVNGSGGRLAGGGVVRGGGERGLGRSSGAGAPTTLPGRAVACFGAETCMGCDDGGDVTNAGAWSSTAVEEAPMSEPKGSALTNSEEEEPGGSENGFLEWA
jgi:hypothetical protein